VIRNHLIIIASVGSATLLIAALAFQYIGKFAPCEMCIWQRWPHLAAMLAGALALIAGGRIWIASGALAAAASGSIGIYHTGVERDWWPGPASCTGDWLTAVGGSELLSTTEAVMPVMCDEVAWELMTLSMASWNALASLVLMSIWLWALRFR